MSKHYAQKNNQMKEEMGYKSPDCSDDSWSGVDN
jgi:hypothetical protein